MLLLVLQYTCMSESERGFHEHHEAPRGHWKGWAVAVYGSASNEATFAIANSRKAGEILARSGMDAVNGGYNVGSMGALAEGFTRAAKELGFSEREIKPHLKGVIFSEKAIGPELARKRGVIPNATIKRTHSLPERAGGIMERADAYIATEGGSGTLLEVLLTGQNQWAQEQRGGSVARKPIILIDSTGAMEEILSLIAHKLPGGIRTLTENTYFLNSFDPKTGLNSSATLENDPVMARKLETVLELFYLRSLRDAVTEEQRQRMHELDDSIHDPDSDMHVPTLKQKVDAFQRLGIRKERHKPR